MVILGGGESGVGAAILAKQKGYEVFLSDAGNLADKYKKELDEAGIEYESGKHSEERILNTEYRIQEETGTENGTVKKRRNGIVKTENWNE